MQKSSRRAFLDLGVDGTHLGRIVIKVIDEGNYALNFLHMCAGDMGPSYADSRVSRVGLKGKEGEFMELGRYALEEGTSWKPVMTGVDWNRERGREVYEMTEWNAGKVFGWFSADYASMFEIVTRDDPSWRVRGCFGMVEEGLDVLRDAIHRYPDIRMIRITACGLIFSC